MAFSLSGDEEDYESDGEQVRAHCFLCLSCVLLQYCQFVCVCVGLSGVLSCVCVCL